MTSLEETNERGKLWKKINEGFELIEKQQARFKELVDTLERLMKEHKEKFPGS